MTKKAKTKPTPAKKRSAEPISNGAVDLRDDELRALALNHKGLFSRALAAKKAKDADFRNACKKIKAELGDTGVAIIKAMVELDSPEGEAAVISRIRAQATAAKWAGLPVGTQIELSLGQPDRTPAVDRAYDEGKKASMENQPRKPPHAPETEASRAWFAGYDDNQRELAGGIKAPADIAGSTLAARAAAD